MRENLCFSKTEKRLDVVVDDKNYPNLNRVICYYSNLARPVELLQIAVEYLGKDSADANERIGLPFCEVTSGGDHSRTEQQLS